MIGVQAMEGRDPVDKHFFVSDGTLVLDLWPAEEGGYSVTSPVDPAPVTEAETLEEALERAYDVQKTPRAAREKRHGHPTVAAIPTEILRLLRIQEKNLPWRREPITPTHYGPGGSGSNT